jgi:hypothetical protein
MNISITDFYLLLGAALFFGVAIGTGIQLFRDKDPWNAGFQDAKNIYEKAWIEALVKWTNARYAALEEARKEIDHFIKRGPLEKPWENEQRNGFVLAHNLVVRLIENNPASAETPRITH